MPFPASTLLLGFWNSVLSLPSRCCSATHAAPTTFPQLRHCQLQEARSDGAGSSATDGAGTVMEAREGGRDWSFWLGLPHPGRCERHTGASGPKRVKKHTDLGRGLRKQSRAAVRALLHTPDTTLTTEPLVCLPTKSAGQEGFRILPLLASGSVAEVRISALGSFLPTCVKGNCGNGSSGVIVKNKMRGCV